MNRNIYACHVTKDLKRQVMITLCCHIMVDIHMWKHILILWKNSRCTEDHSRNVKNPTALQHLVRTEPAYKFLKNNRGSPAYWQHELYDVLAMLCSLGIPTWFLTLSAEDLHWPEMIQAVALQLGRSLSRDDVMKMSIAKRSTLLLYVCFNIELSHSSHNTYWTMHIHLVT